jgi:hypothetical protein
MPELRSHCCGINIARRAILIVCFQSALACADSYIPTWKNFAIPNCRTAMTRSCDLKQDLTLRPITHWNSALRLHAGGEGIQLQIRRAVLAKVRQESVCGPLVLLPTAVSGQSQFSRPDPIEDLLMRIARKLLLSDHPWRYKPSPRCRNHPGAPGCE